MKCQKNVVFNIISNDFQIESAFQYGKNIGVSFQLIDDLLDFTSTGDILGETDWDVLRLADTC